MNRFLAAIAVILLAAFPAYAQTFPLGWTPAGPSVSVTANGTSQVVKLGWVGAVQTAPPLAYVCNFTGSVIALVNVVPSGGTVAAAGPATPIFGGSASDPSCSTVQLGGAQYIAVITSGASANLIIYSGTGSMFGSLPTGAGGGQPLTPIANNTVLGNGSGVTAFPTALTLGSTLTAGASSLSVTTATTSQLGAVEPDGTTISISGGVISAISGGGGINQLTGDVTAGPGTGSQASTVAAIGGKAFSLGGPLSTTGTATVVLAMPSSGTPTYTFPAASATLATLGANIYSGAQTATGFNATTLGSATAVAYGFNSAKTGWYSPGQDAKAALSVNGSELLDYGDRNSGAWTFSGTINTSGIASIVLAQGSLLLNNHGTIGIAVGSGGTYDTFQSRAANGVWQMGSVGFSDAGGTLNLATLNAGTQITAAGAATTQSTVTKAIGGFTTAAGSGNCPALAHICSNVYVGSYAGVVPVY